MTWKTVIKVLLFLSVLLTALPALAGTGTTTTVTLCERSYRLYVPLLMPSNAPLLVALHAGHSNAVEFRAQLNFSSTTALEDLADSHKFYIVYASGTEPLPAAGTKVWNAGRNCCTYAYQSQQQDRAFIHNIIKHMKENYSIDAARVFLTGFSNGSFLAYDYACHYTDIAGITVFAARLLTDHRDCGTVAIPIYHVYGKLDENVPEAGGLGPADGVVYPPLSDTVDFLTSKGATFTIYELPDADHNFLNIKNGLISQYSTTAGDVIAHMISP